MNVIYYLISVMITAFTTAFIFSELPIKPHHGFGLAVLTTTIFAFFIIPLISFKRD